MGEISGTERIVRKHSALSNENERSALSKSAFSPATELVQPAGFWFYTLFRAWERMQFGKMMFRG